MIQQKQTRLAYSSACYSAAIVIAIDSDIYKVLISGIIPRPISFMSTISEGVESLAPFRKDAPPVLNALCTLTWLESIVGLSQHNCEREKSQGFTASIIIEPFVQGRP